MKIVKKLLSLVTLLIVTSVTHAAALLPHLSRTTIPSIRVTPTLFNATTFRAPSRSVCNYNDLKGLHSEPTEEGKTFSPVIGAAYWETKFIERFYDHGMPSTIAHQLVTQLFHRQGPQFRPTEKKSNPAYSLTPSVLGSVMGAAKKGVLTETDTQKKITTQWRDAFRTLSTGDPISHKKIQDFLTLINTNYQKDPTTTNILLTGFLYAKSEPKKDLLDYLTHAHTHVPALKNTDSTYMSNLLHSNYTQSEQRDYLNQLQGAGHSAHVQMDLMSEKPYEATISALIHNQKEATTYPPQIRQGSYGFKGQAPRPNCSESAHQDLFNILLFNPETKSCDLTQLPSTITPRDDFKAFYHTHTLEKASSSETAQAWMDLVAGHPFITYFDNKNYELDGNPNNLLALSNYFFNINAKDFTELGTLLSTPERSITFKPNNTKNPTAIACSVINKKSGNHYNATINYSSMHVELSVPERAHKGTHILHSSSCCSAAHFDTQFNKQHNLLPFNSELPAVEEKVNVNQHSYYLFDVADPNKLLEVTYHALSTAATPEQATHAFHFIKNLPQDDHFRAIVTTAIAQNQASTQFNQGIADYFKQHGHLALICYIQDGDIEAIKKMLILDPSIVNQKDNRGRTPLLYAIKEGNISIIEALLNHGADTTLCSTHGMTVLHDLILYAPSTSDCTVNEKYLAIITLLLKQNPSLLNERDEFGRTPLFHAVEKENISIIEALLNQGADATLCDMSGETIFDYLITDATSNSDSAANEKYLAIMTLLLKHDPSLLNQRNKYGGTPLFYAVGRRNISLTEELLTQGADATLCDIDGKTILDYLIMDATSTSDRTGYEKDLALIALLLKYNPSLTKKINMAELRSIWQEEKNKN